MKEHIKKLLTAPSSTKYWYPLSVPTYDENEICEAIDSMVTFKTSMWDKTKNFEKAFAAQQNCAEAIMVNSGSSADLLLTFLLTNKKAGLLKDGDEILIPVLTWPTQIWSAMMANLSVKLVDVNPLSLNADAQIYEKAITSKTKALFLVHLMGNPCNMDEIRTLADKHNLLIIEDCCEALGSTFDGEKVGNFGIGGAFSFFFSHHMMTMEGGMITTNNRDHAEILRVLRAHGWQRNTTNPVLKDGIDPRYTFVNWGFNVRPTELQAGFGIHQLNKLPQMLDRREAQAKRFFEFVQTTGIFDSPVVNPKAKVNWLSLPLVIRSGSPFSKKHITDKLEESGVETRPIVTGNLARHPVAAEFKEFEGHFPGADLVHDNGFYVGLCPYSDDEKIERLIETFKQILGV